MIAKYKKMECVAGSVSKRRATLLDLFKHKHFITIIIFSPNSHSSSAEEADSNPAI